MLPKQRNTSACRPSPAVPNFSVTKAWHAVVTGTASKKVRKQPSAKQGTIKYILQSQAYVAHAPSLVFSRSFWFSSNSSTKKNYNSNQNHSYTITLDKRILFNFDVWSCTSGRCVPIFLGFDVATEMTGAEEGDKLVFFDFTANRDIILSSTFAFSF